MRGCFSLVTGRYDFENGDLSLAEILDLFFKVAGDSLALTGDKDLVEGLVDWQRKDKRGSRSPISAL